MLNALSYHRISGNFLVAVLTCMHSVCLATESFDAIYSRAHAMGETVEGKAYEKQFYGSVGPFMRDALEACTKNTRTPYIVNLVFVIATDGAVRRIIPAPHQPVSACVADKFHQMRLPPPPKNDWLVAVNISVKE